MDEGIRWLVFDRHQNEIYLTAERFRYQFVEALRSSDPLSFKEKFRSIDILLIDLGDEVTISKYLEDYFGPNQNRGANEITKKSEEGSGDDERDPARDVEGIKIAQK